MNETGKIIQAASRFGGSTSQDERDRLVAAAVDEAVERIRERTIGDYTDDATSARLQRRG